MSGRKKKNNVVVDSDSNRPYFKKPTIPLRPPMSSAGSNALRKSTSATEDKITSSSGPASKPSVTASANESELPIQGPPPVDIPIRHLSLATWPRIPRSSVPSSSSAGQKSDIVVSASKLTPPARVASTTDQTGAAKRGSLDSRPSSGRSQVSNNGSKFIARSLPTKDPMGSSHWSKKIQLENRDELIKISDTSNPRKQKALMLTAGQGGTFGYGSLFQDEHGNSLTREQSKSAESKTKHLDCYGSDTRLIGTKGCVSCLGVYFEIEGNRVFCAHINTWHTKDDTRVDMLKPETEEYEEIRAQIYFRIKNHAKNYGWDRTSVKMGTVKLVSPHPEATAFAAPDAICKDFFRLDHRVPIELAHGFLVAPGFRNVEGGPQMRILQVEYEDWDNDKISLYYDVPDDFEEMAYTNPDGTLVKQTWTYTVNWGLRPRFPAPLKYDR